MGHAIASGSLWSFFDTVLAHAAWILDWGMYVVAAAILILALLGLIPRFRWVAAASLCMLAASSPFVIVLIPTARFEFGQWLFLLPCAAVLLFGVWLYRAERRLRRMGRQIA
jgi:hypothetical protein